MSQRDLVGTFTLQGYQDGPLARAAKSGAMLCLDEFNTLPAEAMDQLNGVLDGEQTLVVANNGGERINLNGLVVMTAMNPPTYASRQLMSQAMRSRLTEVTLDAPNAFAELAGIARAAFGSHADASVQGALIGAMVTLHQWTRSEYEHGRLGDALMPEAAPNFTLRQLNDATRVMACKCRSGVPPVTAFVAAARAVYGHRSPQASDAPQIEAQVQALAQRLAHEDPEAFTSEQSARATAPADIDVEHAIILYDGGTYEDPTRNGLPHGEGELQFKDGNGYRGEFCLGVRHCQGVEIYTDKRVYTGAFAQDLRHGQGTLRGGGQSVEGDWTRGSISSGTIAYDNGDVYTGGVADNRPRGQGAYVYSDGTRVEGTFDGARISSYDNIQSPEAEGASAGVVILQQRLLDRSRYGRMPEPEQRTRSLALARWANALPSPEAGMVLAKHLMSPDSHPSDFADVTELTVLPPYLESLEHARLSTASTAMPLALLRELESVETLSLHAQNAERVDTTLKVLGEFPNLTGLGLSAPSQAYAPNFNFRGAFQSLEDLHLVAGDAPAAVPGGLGALPKLRQLRVEGRGFAALPADLKESRTLEYLILKSSGVVGLPNLTHTPLRSLVVEDHADDPWHRRLLRERSVPKKTLIWGYNDFSYLKPRPAKDL